MRVVARQGKAGLLVPVMVGLFLIALGIISPWSPPTFAWWSLLLSAWFCLGGAFFAFVGWRNWRPGGAGLMLDEQGLWWKYGSLHLLRWDQIVGVKPVQWTNEGDEEQGLILGLRSDGPLEPPEAAWFSTGDLQRRFGPLPWEHMVLLYDESWRWNPDEVKVDIEKSLVEPSIREKW